MLERKMLSQKNKIIILFLVAFIYFLLAIASEFLFEPTHTLFTIRLAPGFGLIVALTYGLPAMFGVLFGELLYLYFLHNSEITAATSIALAATAMLYVYIGIRLIGKYVECPHYLTDSFDCYKLFILGGFVASLIPSLLAVFCISLIDPDVQQLFLPLVAHWWLGQGLGVLLISPITLCVVYKSKSIWQTRVPLIPVILTTLLVVMATIYTYVSVQEKEKLMSTLDQKALTISTLLKLQVSSYAEELFRVSSLFEYSFDIDPLEFEAFSNNVKNRQSGVHAISYQKLVKADERVSYEDRMRKIYSNKFEIIERDGSGSFKRASERDAYTPITMRSIYDKNARIMGFDTLTSVYSKTAREQARLTNKLVISRPFSLDSSIGDNKSIILILPLSNNNIFSGFVSLSVYVRSAIQSALENMDMEGFSLIIMDATSSDNNLIYTKNTLNNENILKLIKDGQIEFKSLKWNYQIIPNLYYLKNILMSQMLVIIFYILLGAILSVRLLEHTGKKHEFDRLFTESKERNRLLLDSTAEAIYGIDLNGECTFANNACLDLLGYQTERELHGKNMHKLIRHSRIDGTPYSIEESKIYQSSQEGKGSHVDDEVLWRADGSSFHSECRSLPIRIHGAIIGSVVSFTDITTRVEAKAIEQERFKTLTHLKDAKAWALDKLVDTQEELRKSQALYSQAESLGKLGHWEWDHINQKMISCSNQFAQIYEMTVDEVIAYFSVQENEISVVHPEDQERYMQQLIESEEQLTGMDIEFRIITRSGKVRHIHQLSEKVLDDENRLVTSFGTEQDITERTITKEKLKVEQERTKELLKIRTQELKETQLQLFQAEKMDTIGKLSAGIAHEVKNPLAIIQLGINYLQKTLRKDEVIYEVVEDIDHAIQRADSVIKELIDFSASRQLNLEKQEMNPVIEESLSLVKHELTKHNINVDMKMEENLPFVEIDRSKLQQVFINIFMNAIHAMDSNGILVIRTYASEFENEMKKHNLNNTGQFSLTRNVIVVEIEDTGPGINSEVESKIFEPFFTTKKSGMGIGLGLTVTENIVRLHSAFIDIKNSKKGGVIASIIFQAI